MSLNFEITGNNADLRKKLQQARQDILNTGKIAESTFEKVGNSVRNATAAFAAGAFSKELIQNIVKVRGEFQQLEIAFTTMLGSGEKATKLMNQLTKFAGETPFGLQSASAGAKQLIAYGSAAEDVIGELTMLGDVAAGTGQQIGDLVYLYGTLRMQGKAYTMDIRQFAGRGIPIYRELAAVLGVAEKEVNNLVSAGKVGFKEVEQAFKNMTASGSMYGGLMDAQSKSVVGRIEQLKDAIDVLFNNIGRDNEGLIYGVIGSAASLVENYEEVGRIVLELVAAYGAYRAVLITINALQSLNSTIMRQAVLEKKLAAAASVQLSNAEAIAAAKTKMFSIAQAGLLKSLKATAAALLPNPYVLAAAAVAGLGYGIYKLATYQDEAAKSANRLKDATSNYNATIKKEEVNLEILFNRLRNAQEGTERYESAKRDIISQYGDYLNGLNNEIKSLKDVEGAYKAISSAAIQSAKDRAISQGVEAASKAYVESWERNLKEAKKLIIGKFGEVEGAALFDSLQESLSPGGEITKEVQDAISSFDRVVMQSMGNYGGTTSYETNPVADLVADIQKSKKVLDDEVAELESIFGKKSVVSVAETTKTFITAQDEIRTTTASIKQLKSEISGLRSGKTKVEDGESVAELISAKEKELKAAESALESLTGRKSSEISKAAKKELKEQEHINEEMRKLTERNISDRIALMDDGTQKELALIEDKYDRAISEIKKQEAEWKKAQKGKLTFEQEAILHVASINAEAGRTKGERDITKTLINQYEDYAAQRLSIEKKYNKDIEALQAERIKAEISGNSELVDQLNRSIAQATKDKGTELISFDFDLLKKDPEYVRAFEDLKNTSTETLNSLLSQLEAMKGKASEILEPTELREYMSTIQDILDELVARDPFKALGASQKKLTKLMEDLSKARKRLEDSIRSGNMEAQAQAQKEYNEALDATTKASNEAIKAQQEVSNTMNTLYDAISGVGGAMGGTAGEIITFIGNIGKFVSTTAEGITKTAETTSSALRAIQNAVAILAIIQAAIQLMQQLDALFADTHQKYEKYAAKLKEINQLTDAVNEYELAVMQAKHAEENWFATDSMKSLKDSYSYSQKALESYYAKANELQAEYVNETGSGWLTKAAKYITPIVQGSVGDVGGGIATYLGLDKVDDYVENAIKAVDNLVIETRKKSKGFLGSGIGGKSQKTENLVDWVRNQGLGELFEDDGMLNKELAQKVLDKYGEKLVGETKETLEYLLEMQEEYESFMNQLQEYVSSLYEPLADNIVDSLWMWFDEGKDALDSFKEYASDTFRDIVSDMMRTIVLENVVAGFGDQIQDLYSQYAKGSMTEEQLMKNVAALTDDLIGRYEDQIPALQDMMNIMGSTFRDVGINLQNVTDADNGASDNTIKGAYAKASQESIDLLAGQTGAARIALEDIANLMKDGSNASQLAQLMASGDVLSSIRDMAISGWSNVAAIHEVSRRIEDVAGEVRVLNQRIADSNDSIQDNTNRMTSSLGAIETKGVKLIGTGLGL